MSQSVLITGANRGIGLALAEHYAQHGAKVTALVRKSSDELAKVATRVIENVDVTDSDSIKAAQQALENERFDLLINNAGILTEETLQDFDLDRIRRQLEVNTLAPINLVYHFKGLLVSGAKIAMITSRMGSIEDNGSGGYIGYRLSKAALNAASVSLAHELKEQGVSLALLHPGFVQTEMVNFAGHITPKQAAEGLTKRIAELTLENTGGFWHSNGERLPW